MKSATKPDFDVIVIGAGVAGLAALRELDRACLRVMLLEARDRIGGRIYTIHDPLSPVPLELGAEFVHGRPAELWELMREAGLSVYDGTDASRHMKAGKVERNADAWVLLDSVIRDMRAAAKEADQSFEEFLQKSKYDEAARLAARGYVEGFNAADANEISIQALSEETAAADEIDGDRIFRFSGGYDAVPLHLLRSVPGFGTKLRLNSIVESVEWRVGCVSIRCRNALTNTSQTWTAKRAAVTVPLGVLQAGTIAFAPEPVEILKAARKLRFGQVFRIVLRFRDAFWESREELKDAGFILSDENEFPTWWTTLAMRSPVLIGWSAGARTEGLRGLEQNEIVARALASLSRIMGIPEQTIRHDLEAIYFHDWQADPFSLGAYSYVPAGALEARKQMAIPVEGTLYFAGEATNQNGHSATVHGAIASGRRAARQILA